MEAYDVIVIGVGGVGSASLYHLAKQELNVLGIEQFSLGHGRGSSHGQTRIIRQAYFEDPCYVPLLQQAYQLWNELENEVARKLFIRCGLVEVGPANGVVIPGVRQSAAQHHLQLEDISPIDFSKRFPSLHLPDEFEAVFEPTAGYLMVEPCVLSHARMAMQHGAKILTGQTVDSWTSNGKAAEVRTTQGDVFRSQNLVICGGAWTSRLLRSLSVPLTVTRKQVHWFDASTMPNLGRTLSAFFYEVTDGHFYGLPAVNNLGIKIAQHSDRKTQPDPDRLTNELDQAEFTQVRKFAAEHVPGLATSPATRHETCMYTLTPDEHFLIDRHPEHPNVLVVGGLSGHGFKFSSVLGRIASDMTVSSESTDLVGRFGFSRFSGKQARSR